MNSKKKANKQRSERDSAGKNFQREVDLIFWPKEEEEKKERNKNNEP